MSVTVLLVKVYHLPDVYRVSGFNAAITTSAQAFSAVSTPIKVMQWEILRAYWQVLP